MVKLEEVKMVGLFDILFNPRTGHWVWFFDDRETFREVTQNEMFTLKFLFERNGLNPYEVEYVLFDDGFETVWCKGN